MSDTFADELRQSLPAEMEQLNVPGCAVALIRDSVPTEILCFGTADRTSGEAVTADTRFSLQSVSKSIAAWAVITLVEQGRLDLDRPIADYHRRWTLPPSDQFDLTLVTPRRLLSHHAGVTVAGFRGVELDQTQYTLLDAMQGRLPPPNAEQTAHYEYWDLPRDDDIITVTYPPGQGWNYSNAGFGLLELAVEDITGESFADYVARAVFAPLGMEGSYFQVPYSASRHLTTNYALLAKRPFAIDRPGKSIYQDPIPFAFGGSGLVTSPADFDRFLAMLVNRGVHQGKRVMSEAAVAMGTSNLLPDGADLTGTWVAGQHFGAGGVVGTGKDEGLFGWSGAAGTIGFAQMKMALRTSLYVQYMPQEKLPVLAEFPKAVGADLSARGKAP